VGRRAGREREENGSRNLAGPGSGAQRHSRRRKMRHRNSLGGGKNKEIGMGTKFKIGKLILSQKNKIVAAICYILRLKRTNFDFDWGSATDLPQFPRPRWGSSQRSLRPPSWI